MESFARSKSMITGIITFHGNHSRWIHNLKTIISTGSFSFITEYGLCQNTCFISKYLLIQSWWWICDTYMDFGWNWDRYTLNKFIFYSWFYYPSFSLILVRWKESSPNSVCLTEGTFNRINPIVHWGSEVALKHGGGGVNLPPS